MRESEKKDIRHAGSDETKKSRTLSTVVRRAISRNEFPDEVEGPLDKISKFLRDTTSSSSRVVRISSLAKIYRACLPPN